MNQWILTLEKNINTTTILLKLSFNNIYKQLNNKIEYLLSILNNTNNNDNKP